MKKLLVIAAVLATVIGARAGDGTADATSQGNPIFDVGGAKASGSGIVASLYWSATAGGTYVPFTTASGGAVAPFPFLTGGGAGFWDSGANGTVYALGQSGATVFVVERAWNASANNFLTASTPSTTVGNKSGSSTPFSVVLGGGGSPPAVPVDLSGIASFTLTATPVVPEPSTIALGLLGAGALLLRRRK